MLSDDDVRELLEGTTPGPWMMREVDGEHYAWDAADLDRGNGLLLMTEVDTERDLRNLALAAAAPDLAAEVLRRGEELDQARADLATYEGIVRRVAHGTEYATARLRMDAQRVLVGDKPLGPRSPDEVRLLGGGEQ